MVRPDDAEFSFEFTYVFKGKMNVKRRDGFIKAAKEELHKNVKFKHWISKDPWEVKNTKGFITETDGDIIRVIIRGDYL